MRAITRSPGHIFPRLAAMCRRLHAKRQSRKIANRLQSLAAQIEILREQMAIDDQLAENNRRLYLKSPVLQSRREEDRRYMAQLQATRELLLNHLAALQ